MANEELKENKIEKKKIFNESRLSDILVGIFFWRWQIYTTHTLEGTSTTSSS